jgi:hypothetical protein
LPAAIRLVRIREPMTTRTAALLVALIFATAAGRAAEANSPLLSPSWSALAAADEDPPLRPDHRPVKNPDEDRPVVPAEEVPVYKTWWFWALTAAVVGGVVIFGVTTFEAASHPPKACTPGTVACFGDRQ